MDNRYIALFKEIAHATEVLAERVKDADLKNKTEETTNAAEGMREQYSKLYDKLRATDFDDTTLTRIEFAQLLIGAGIVVGNLKSHINELTTAVDGYEKRIMPLLQNIVDGSEDDAGAQEIAQKVFVITEQTQTTKES